MSEEILQKFKKFAGRSKAAYSKLYERIKRDRSFLSGARQWTKDDDPFVDPARNRITVNVISNQCHSVANQYSNWSYSWATGDAEIDREVDDFFAQDSNRFASEEALLDSVSFGLGVMALGSDIDVSGKEVPVIYSITDPERCLLDPDMTELDGGDAVEGALVDYRNREWVRIHLGDEYVPDEDAVMVVTNGTCKDLVPIITYYWLDTDGCHVATFVNEREVVNTSYDEEGNEFEDETVIPIHRIPIWPVWGERTWDENDKETYCGLVARSKDVQRIVNYCFTQLADRLALSPKPQWAGYMESFKGYDKYYKRAGSGQNNIVPAQRLANDGKTVLDLPKRFDANIQFQDLQGIMTGTLDMMTSITGVDSKGLANAETEVTATAVLYTAKVFQNNVKHYFSHLRASFQSLGNTVMVLLGHPDTVVKVVQGPDEATEMQTARAELTALMGVVEPNQKPALVNAILRTHPDNDILAQLYVDLNSTPAPTAMEQEMQQTAMMMKEALDEKNLQLQQMQAQLEEYRKQIENTDKDRIFELKKMELEHQYAVEDEILKAQLSSGMDADKAAVEAERDRIKLQGEADRAALDVEVGRQRLATQQASDALKLETQAAKAGLDIGTGIAKAAAQLKTTKTTRTRKKKGVNTDEDVAR